MDRLSSNGQMLSQIDLSNVPHSSFDRRNHNFLSGKLGKIICTRVDKVYPGDRIKGHIETVANFEPLVAPIMGSMVLKQESFYVPDSILWKNAHKFFTAKGGFNTPVPSVSPINIYRAYEHYSLIPVYDVSTFSALGQKILDDEHYTASERTGVIYTDLFSAMKTGMDSFSTTYGVGDLFKPIWYSIDKWFSKSDADEYDYDSSKMTDLIKSLDAADAPAKLLIIHQIANALVEIYTTCFEHYFGVSSHLDYMGFPVVDDWRSFFSEDHYFGEEDSRNRYKLQTLIFGNTYEEVSGPEALFSNIAFNWLPFRAAYVIWYWNYRDELLETLALDPESDTLLSDSVTQSEMVLLTLLRVRCWYKDTFTTALTNTGSANLVVPVDLEDHIEYHYFDASGSILDNTNDFQSAYQAGASYVTITMAGGLTYKLPMNYFPNSFSPTGSISESLNSSFLSLDLFDRIHRLRTFLQKRLILGYEYDDMVWSSFMVKLSNVRMRIPELLSRGRDAVQLNTVVNNTTTSEQIAGDKSAVAWASGRTSDINYFAEEHGFFLSFMTIMPVQSYTGGMQRLYMKREQFDFMWPEFATMGMDAVYNFELSAPRSEYSDYGLTDETAMQVFGYQGRYYDLKSRLDECHGRLRTDLHYMTFSREFDMKELPKLNYQFVHCWPSIDMFVVDDPNVDVIRTIDVHHALDWERRLPVPSEML